MEASQKLAKKYDYVLVGFNVASLHMAWRLSMMGASFCLIDSKFAGASLFKWIPSLEEDLFTRVPYCSPTTSPYLNEQTESIDGPALTFDKGDFRSFLGFGQDGILERDVVEKYVAPVRLQTAITPEGFWSSIRDSVEPHLFLDMNLTDLQMEGEQITSLGLNGVQSVSGEHFVFFSHLSFLFDRVGSQSKKLASQFAKAPWFSSVSWIVHHRADLGTPVELDQLYLLTGSKRQACLGQFHRVKGELVSRWESFFPAELTSDSETTGSHLKEIKKQVKRAFPGVGTSQDHEHIVIHEGVFADLSQLPVTDGKVNKFNNLYIGSPLLTEGLGWWHERQTAEALLRSQNWGGEFLASPSNEVAAPSAPC